MRTRKKKDDNHISRNIARAGTNEGTRADGHREIPNSFFFLSQGYRQQQPTVFFLSQLYIMYVHAKHNGIVITPRLSILQLGKQMGGEAQTSSKKEERKDRARMSFSSVHQ